MFWNRITFNLLIFCRRSVLIIEKFIVAIVIRDEFLGAKPVKFLVIIRNWKKRSNHTSSNHNHVGEIESVEEVVCESGVLLLEFGEAYH